MFVKAKNSVAFTATASSILGQITTDFHDPSWIIYERKTRGCPFVCLEIAFSHINQDNGMSVAFHTNKIIYKIELWGALCLSEKKL